MKCHLQHGGIWLPFIALPLHQLSNFFRPISDRASDGAEIGRINRPPLINSKGQIPFHTRRLFSEFLCDSHDGGGISTPPRRLAAPPSSWALRAPRLRYNRHAHHDMCRRIDILHAPLRLLCRLLKTQKPQCQNASLGPRNRHLISVIPHSSNADCGT